MSSKKWLAIFFSIVITVAIIAAILVIIIDPCFHYHAPLSFIKYNLNNEERYLNNGIIKHYDYDYDAIITGTSHTENFKVSEFNNLFNCNSIKVPLAGAEFKELAEQTSIAIKYNKNIKYILYGITYSDILNDKDAVKYSEYPTYLYDENIFNDYKYIFSGQAIKLAIRDITFTLLRSEKLINKLISSAATNFDEYVNWSNKNVFSKEAVLKQYKRVLAKSEITELSEEEINRVKENIEENIINVINLNKDIQYYMFLAPHSIVWWDSISQNGDILKYLEAEEIWINYLLECENVKLYSFFNNYELTCNLDNYRDFTHYSGDINSQILEWIKNDEYLITKENVNEYLEKERNFYLNYNYNQIFIETES